MHGDFTRDTFNPKRHYQQVLLQQGRVLLDANFNEFAALLAHRDQTTAADLIGDCGGPADRAAFRIFSDLNELTADEKQHLADLHIATPLANGDFFISAGHYYVDGILCENESAIPFTNQPDRFNVQALPPGNYMLYADVFQRHLTELEAPSLREPALGGPDSATRAKTVWQIKADPIGPLNNPDVCSTGTLDHLRDPRTARLTADTIKPPADDDPCTLPPEAGYTGLENQLYRVEIHQPGKALDAANAPGVAVTLPAADAPQNVITIAAAVPWQKGQPIEIFPAKPGAPMRGQLAWLTDVAGTTLTINIPIDPAFVAADQPMARQVAATWKWSRENGSVVTTIEKIDGDKITVSSIGPDAKLQFAVDSWVEILDDALELEGLPGQLAQIKDIAGNVITLMSPANPLAATPANVDPARFPKLRRWEAIGAVKFIADPPSNWLPLESGIQIRFADADYRTGHYWQIPARTATAESPDGDIQWPTQNSLRVPRPPRGITHHLCKLAIVTVAAGSPTSLSSDCRCLFPALSATPRLFYLSGDGQEVMPVPTNAANLYKLPHPLIVGVANAQCLPAAATVRFTVTSGAGRVAAQGAAPAGASVDLPITSNGQAACDFHLDGTNWTQQVSAALLDQNGNAITPLIFFNANLSVAAQVAFDPGSCSGMQGRNTVQDAISQLASMARIDIFGGDGQDANPGDTLAKPIQVSISSACGPVAGAKISFQAEGNGALNGGGSGAAVTSGPDGLAACSWTPDPALPTQQLTATLVQTPANQPIEKPSQVIFTANIRQAGADGCCCVSIGPRGDFPTIEAALAKLLKTTPDICLCLMAGDHLLQKPLELTKPANVHIRGCGPGTRLRLQGAGIAARRLNSFALEDMQVLISRTNDPFVFLNCKSVLFRGCDIEAADKPIVLLRIAGADDLLIRDCTLQSLFPFWQSPIEGFDVTKVPGLTFPPPLDAITSQTYADAVEQIAQSLIKAPPAALKSYASLWGDQSPAVQDLTDTMKSRVRLMSKSLSQLNANQSQPSALDLARTAAFLPSYGIALQLADSPTRLTIENSILLGELSILGASIPSISTESLPALQKLIARNPKNKIGGEWHLRGNDVTRITILQQSGNATLSSVPFHLWFRENALWSNNNVLVAYHHDFSANAYHGQGDAGWVVGNDATYVANWATNDFRLFHLCGNTLATAAVANVRLNIVV
ncbi:MAG TPA: DUF6519 domain-containing protein [Phycisphaerae bacterium]|nr:DUF6519 domain-containing protein [Phycisphaerae bacterium]